MSSLVPSKGLDIPPYHTRSTMVEYHAWPILQTGLLTGRPRGQPIWACNQQRRTKPH